jgi:hypothetical protein
MVNRASIRLHDELTVVVLERILSAAPQIWHTTIFFLTDRCNSHRRPTTKPP